MTRKLAFGVMACCLAAFSSLGQEPRKTSVAVYPIKAAGAVDKAVAQALSALLSSELIPSPKLRVIEEAMLKEVMARQAMNISDLCDDTVCQVEIGKLVQAQKIVTGDLVKLGNKYILSLRLIDIQSGTTEFSTKDGCTCSEDQLDQLVALAAAKVRNHFGDAVFLPALPSASAVQSIPAEVSHPAASLAPPPASIPQGEATVYLKYTKNACIGKNSYSLDGEKFKLREEECVKKVVRSGNQTVRDEYSNSNATFPALPGESYYFEATGACPANAGKRAKNGVLYQLPQTPPPAWAATCPDISQLSAR